MSAHIRPVSASAGSLLGVSASMILYDLSKVWQVHFLTASPPLSTETSTLEGGIDRGELDHLGILFS